MTSPEPAPDRWRTLRAWLRRTLGADRAEPRPRAGICAGCAQPAVVTVVSGETSATGH